MRGNVLVPTYVRSDYPGRLYLPGAEGRELPYTFTHVFSFTSSLPTTSARQVLSHTWEMGGAADFVWFAVNVQQASATGGGDPAAEVLLSFFSELGTRPHQSEPVLGALWRGSGRSGAGFSMKAKPFHLQPTRLSRNDSLRCEIANEREATYSVRVAVIGKRVVDL